MSLTVHLAHDSRLATLSCPKNTRRNQGMLRELRCEYFGYQRDFRALVAEQDYDGMAQCLHAYATYAKELEGAPEVPHVPTLLTSKSKFYSSILEEVPTLMLLPHLQDILAQRPDLDGRAFHLGGRDCAIRIGYSPDAQHFVERKRIDFCLSVHDPRLEVDIALMGLEVKKYVDKTMFGTILETYKSLRAFRPTTYYGFLVEDEARDADVALNSEMYTNEFILTGKKRCKTGLHAFQGDVLKSLHERLLAHMDHTFSLLAA